MAKNSDIGWVDNIIISIDSLILSNAGLLLPRCCETRIKDCTGRSCICFLPYSRGRKYSGISDIFKQFESNSKFCVSFDTQTSHFVIYSSMSLINVSHNNHCKIHNLDRISTKSNMSSGSSNRQLL